MRFCVRASAIGEVVRYCRPSALQECSSRRFIASKTCDPLRILFCGSDNFSIASLNAVYHEHLKDPNFVKSIDVVCRPGKRVGRGLQNVREVPIASMAREFALPLHQIDTFTGWQPPKPDGQPINLVIAVSFGLLVPPRILGSAKYGGLNVHPSMLPDFRGAAPLHHTLLNRCKTTGITLQTLHPKHFDQGNILLQTPQPGFDIPDPNHVTVPSLLALVTPKAADLLVEGLRSRVFVPPLQTFEPRSKGEDAQLQRPAPRITPEDRMIDWKTWTAEEIMLRNRLIGPLWNLVTDTRPPQKEIRAIWSSGFCEATNRPTESFPGALMLGDSSIDSSVYIPTIDGKVLRARKVTLAGKREQMARAALGYGWKIGKLE